MKEILSVDNMRKSDAAAIRSGIDSKELMGRAARGIFDAVTVWKEPVAIVCGKGNNACDGFALALILKDKGISCSCIRLCDSFTEDGKYYYDCCIEKGIDIKGPSDADVKKALAELKQYNTVVDCIFGTGFKGVPDGVFLDGIRAINESGAYVVSADINSGLNGDNGMCDCCVYSDITVSVGGLKSGHFLNMAKDCINALDNADIGIVPVEKPFYLADESFVRNAFPTRKNFSHKGDYGYVTLMGGCEKYTGAIRLSQLAACSARSGAGVVQVAVQKSLASLVGANVLESTIIPLPEQDGQIKFDEEVLVRIENKSKAIAFGMGIGTGVEIAKILTHILSEYKGNLIIDADGLNVLSKLLKNNENLLRDAGCRVILTPHIKEFSGLCGLDTDEILRSVVESSCNFAGKNKVVLLLKGPTTIVTDGENVIFVDRGCPGMATAGSGDVLSGILAAICGYNSDVFLAAAAAAYVNGRAGEMAQDEYGCISQIASDTASQIAYVIKELTDDSI